MAESIFFLPEKAYLFNQRTFLHFNMSYPGYSSIFTKIYIITDKSETTYVAYRVME